jgi:hypothetical protein
MPHYNYKKDFPIAQKTEREVAALLTKVYDAEILAYEDTNKYDILARINNVNYTFEVKEDFIGERTGNVGLEYSCRGKPSGITTSEANFYVYKLHTKNHKIQFVLFNTNSLKKMVANKEYFRDVNGGDPGSNSLNYLFRYDIFINRGRVITP